MTPFLKTSRRFYRPKKTAVNICELMKNRIKNYIKITGLAAVPFGTVQAEDIITIRVAKEDITEGGGSRFVISKENGKGECLKSASILWRNDCLRSVLENTGGWLKAGILNSSHGGMLEGIDGYILREGLPFVASYCFYIGSDGFYFALVRTINKQKHMLVIFSPAEGLCVFSDIPTKSFGCSAVYTDNEWVESKLSFRRWGVHITIRIPWVIRDGCSANQGRWHDRSVSYVDKRCLASEKTDEDGNPYVEYKVGDPVLLKITTLNKFLKFLTERDFKTPQELVSAVVEARKRKDSGWGIKMHTRE